MHLAQVNVGVLAGPLDDPRVADFVQNLDRINALAETSPGFVWRLQGEGGNATDIHPDPDNDRYAINLSVWTSVEALADFAYRSDHVELLRRRREFFEVPSGPIACLWWIPEETVPTVDEALDRLGRLGRHGPTPHAFTFAHRYDEHGERVRRNTDDTCPA